MKFAVFAAGVDVGRQTVKKRSIDFASGQIRVEDFAVHADNDGAKAENLEFTDQIARSAFYSLTPKWVRLIDNSKYFGHREEFTLP